MEQYLTIEETRQHLSFIRMMWAGLLGLSIFWIPLVLLSFFIPDYTKLFYDIVILCHYIFFAYDAYILLTLCPEVFPDLKISSATIALTTYIILQNVGGDYIHRNLLGRLCSFVLPVDIALMAYYSNIFLSQNCNILILSTNISYILMSRLSTRPFIYLSIHPILLVCQAIYLYYRINIGSL
jgi:hypothetical protein